MMLEDIRVNPLINTIMIEWRKPKYVPYLYDVSYSLVDQSSGLVYSRMESFLNEGSTTLCIRGIIRGTQCNWEVKAIYNSATLDSGVSGITQIERTDEGEYIIHCRKLAALSVHILLLLELRANQSFESTLNNYFHHRQIY